MPWRKVCKQFKQLGQFDRSRIIGLLEDGWSKRCILQYIDSRGYTVYNPPAQEGSKTGPREGRHVVRYARTEPTTTIAIWMMEPLSFQKKSHHFKTIRHQRYMIIAFNSKTHRQRLH
ncbi:hypothetical protein TNCT_176651 [Trichonephila clavata]|uniref:Uncharacterized protein n=1 Tax=Trichonephila clavata TaxID=2740835 RepID=A0A8X6F0G0_TRICU|nr:hypothetical protein TNCT_176651 [Trichonephila clavata]